MSSHLTDPGCEIGRRTPAGIARETPVNEGAGVVQTVFDWGNPAVPAREEVHLDGIALLERLKMGLHAKPVGAFIPIRERVGSSAISG